MENYVYSAIANSFYPVSLKYLYENAGTWPDDAIAISDEDFELFTGTPPLGMQRSVGENGLPVWQSIPPLTREQEILIAENERQRLLVFAQQKTSLWQTKLLIGRQLAEDEMRQLNLWVDYIDAVTVLDVSTAPDIVWPMMP
ncbi:tail fiber assembly protein [Escherichia coli]|jgi:Caudovirales tail fibre assembly protein.|uniref:tail fiber assembly protein n=1 Tax=Escherichia coli TaxID=562 RepID=UPI0019CC0BBD|nr:tail fiber assembly protein [Escherichia coli]EFU9410057.1 tail fiber assembly protein [Escherichia coli]HAM7669415.1 tail fiber assembly protein [Escherichia coli]HAX2053228.1 tail fiber assembly protein [Escherichia coli]HBA8301225.1 tail fiber assembly protein [Escherichia coli]HBB2793040.1 tail fiber assembly protein [Escherichia coli]